MGVLNIRESSYLGSNLRVASYPETVNPKPYTLKVIVPQSARASRDSTVDLGLIGLVFLRLGRQAANGTDAHQALQARV